MVSEDGVEDAFDVAGEIQEVVKTGASQYTLLIEILCPPSP